MRHYNTLRYKGNVCDYVFVDSSPILDESQREDVAWNAFDMYFSGDDLRHVISEDLKYEAKVSSQGIKSMGNFSGQQLSAEIETDRGRSGYSIILFKVV